jgi:hypothetical protein
MGLALSQVLTCYRTRSVDVSLSFATGRLVIELDEKL